MKIEAPNFPANAEKALDDENLQGALLHVRSKFIEKRAAAAKAMDDFDAMRDSARDIKNHALANLDQYLIEFEKQAINNGAKVHWAATAI